MNDKKAKKLLKKLIDDLENNGIITNTVVKDLKALRPHAVEEERPLLAKVIRLVFEHIEEYDTFAIGIPDEDPIEDEEGEIVSTPETMESTPEESLAYLFSLIAEPDNKTNRLDMRAYVAALREYAEEN